MLYRDHFCTSYRISRVDLSINFCSQQSVQKRILNLSDVNGMFLAYLLC